MIKKCIFCGKDFNARKKLKACSMKCRIDNVYKNRKLKYKNCNFCGKRFDNRRDINNIRSPLLGDNQFTKKNCCSYNCSARTRKGLNDYEEMDDKIYIYTKKGTIIVDKENNFLLKVRWHIDSVGYATCSPLKKDFGKFFHRRMHKILMGKRKGFEVDHINRNKLDNRLCNLRFLSHRDNLLNSRIGDINELNNHLK